MASNVSQSKSRISQWTLDISNDWIVSTRFGVEKLVSKFIYYKCYFYSREKAWLISYIGAPRGNNYHFFTISSFPLKLKRICNMFLRHMDKPSQPTDLKRWFFLNQDPMDFCFTKYLECKKGWARSLLLRYFIFLEAAATR